MEVKFHSILVKVLSSNEKQQRQALGHTMCFMQAAKIIIIFRWFLLLPLVYQKVCVPRSTKEWFKSSTCTQHCLSFSSLQDWTHSLPSLVSDLFYDTISASTAKHLIITVFGYKSEKNFKQWSQHVIYEYTFSKKSGCHLKILGTRCVIWSKVHTEGPQTLITTVKKFSSTANVAPGICAHLTAHAGRSEEKPQKKKNPVWISGVVGKIRTRSCSVSPFQD